MHEFDQKCQTTNICQQWWNGMEWNLRLTLPSAKFNTNIFILLGTQIHTLSFIKIRNQVVGNPLAHRHSLVGSS